MLVMDQGFPANCGQVERLSFSPFLAKIGEHRRTDFCRPAVPVTSPSPSMMGVLKVRKQRSSPPMAICSSNCFFSFETMTCRSSERYNSARSCGQMSRSVFPITSSTRCPHALVNVSFTSSNLPFRSFSQASIGGLSRILWRRRCISACSLSIRFRAVTSREMPINPATAPVASRKGTLIVSTSMVCPSARVIHSSFRWGAPRASASRSFLRKDSARARSETRSRSV